MAYRPKDVKERILHRLKISQGHLEKVVQMVEDDVYCIDVLHQIYAVENGLKQTNSVILDNHLNTCVADAIKKGEKDKVIAEILEIFKKKSK